MRSGLYEYQSEFIRGNVLRGRAEAGADFLLDVLDERGIAVPDAARTKITECTDYGLLKIWMRRALRAESIDDVFT